MVMGCVTNGLLIKCSDDYTSKETNFYHLLKTKLLLNSHITDRFTKTLRTQCECFYSSFYHNGHPVACLSEISFGVKCMRLCRGELDFTSLQLRFCRL